MGLNILTLGSSKSYVEETADALGAVKGAPATIKSITEVEGGQKVTFEWTGTSGTKQTSDMTVKDGLSITNIEVNSDNTITCTLSDGSTVTTTNKIKTVKGDPGDKGDKLTFNDLTEAEKESLKGNPGYTPVKGTDYWTDEDISEIQSYIDTQIGGALNGSY